VNLKPFLVFFLKGMAMGAADVVPGVSGGTVALLLGIYERLLRAVKSVDLDFLKLLFSFQIKKAIEYADLKFLASVVAGIGVSIVSLGKVFSYLHQNYEIPTMSFFFGLIAASGILISGKVKSRNAVTFSLFAIGFSIAAGVAFLAPATENPNIFYLYLCGAIAICAMILPGVSGSFILLIMGNYFYVLSSIYPPKLGTLIPFALGALTGLALFSRFLTWLMRRFEAQTLALMSGFVVGSLVIIYPWKEKILQSAEIGGKVKEKVVGYIYHSPEINPDFFVALLFAVVGFALVYSTEKIGAQHVGEEEKNG
jgi:putative membrane protein